MKFNIILFIFFSITIPNDVFAGERLARAQIHEYARNWIEGNVEISNVKTKISGLTFNHPSLQDHSQMQSYRYHELLSVKLNTGKRHEWEIRGGGIDFHYYPKHERWTISKRIKLWNNPINFNSLISEADLEERTLSSLGIKNAENITLKQSDYSIKRKIEVKNSTATPLYWIELKAKSIQDISPLSRTVVINAQNGNVISNFSRHVHVEQNLPSTIVRNGAFHIIKNKKKEIDNTDLTTKEKYKDYCQVISLHKDSIGEPLLINPEKCDIVLNGQTSTSKADASAKRAADNSSKILSFYMNNFNQYGFDNEPAKATPITSIVHIGDHFDNAYWDSDLEVMAYGDGANNGQQGSTSDYTLALDIAGHEFTHAIVSHTANFAGPGEPGALNEAFADIFGVLISRSYYQKDNWNIGAELYNNQDGDSDEVALRSLSNPKKFNTSTTINGKAVDVPFPVKYSERLAAQDKTCDDDNDQCEVHANSTIWSHNAYVIDQGLQSQGLNAKAADKLTGELFFLTLTHRLNENTTMKEAAAEVMLTCHEIMTPEQCNMVGAVFKGSELID